jgi:uncharacterized membrane protein
MLGVRGHRHDGRSGLSGMPHHRLARCKVEHWASPHRRHSGMSSASALAFGIGFVAGLRTMTAPAIVSWAAHLGWLHLQGSPLAFMASTTAVVVFTLFASGEYLVDLHPKTPRRTAPGPLIARIVSGGLCGACVCASAGASAIVGAALGGAGGLAGAFAGYEARRRLVKGLRVKDVLIAIPEDLRAIALGFSIVA